MKGETVLSPDLSVVVPCYGGARTLAFVLRSLETEVEDFTGAEVVVVDSSGDRSAEIVAAGHRFVRYVSEPSRLLPGAARNRGAEITRGSYILFLDADCVPQPGWGKTLKRLLLEGPDCASGSALNGTPESTSGSLQYALEFLDFTPQEPGGERDFVPSFQLLVHRSLFLETGGFPPLMAASEDVVFCHLMKKRSVSIRFEPALRVRHLNRSGFSAVFRHMAKLGRWSGAARRRSPEIRGGFLRFCPPAALLLAPYRWWRLLPRLARMRDVTPLRKLAVGAVAPWALFLWACGFAVGLTAGEPEP